MAKQMSSKKAAETKDCIVKMALQLFISKGFNNVSLQDIVTSSGISKGGLFYHFPRGKEEIYKAALDSFFSDTGALPLWLQRNHENVKALIIDGFESIKESKEIIIKSVGCDDDQAILFFFSFLYEATRRFPEFQVAIDASDAHKHEVLEKIFSEGQKKQEIRGDINPKSLAIEFDALLQQLLYLYFVNHTMKNNFGIIQEISHNFYIRLLP